MPKITSNPKTGRLNVGFNETQRTLLSRYCQQNNIKESDFVIKIVIDHLINVALK